MGVSNNKVYALMIHTLLSVEKKNISSKYFEAFASELLEKFEKSFFCTICTVICLKPRRIVLTTKVCNWTHKVPWRPLHMNRRLPKYHCKHQTNVFCLHKWIIFCHFINIICIDWKHVTWGGIKAGEDNHRIDISHCLYFSRVTW